MLLWAAGVACVLLLIFRKLDSTPSNALVFNEMLVRLLHGRFDISPATIGQEAIVYHGRTYAYFGIFCALLRLPLLAVGLIGLDATKLSMIAAAAVSLAARLAALDLAMSRAPGLPRPVRLIVMGAVVLGGESVQFLRPSFFQEVCSWGDALGAVFVLLALKRILGAGGRTWRLYAGMAAVAGLALLCRVSVGAGLYAALGLMLSVEAWRGRARLAALRTLAPAALVLALFAGAAMGVNAARWGRPLMFVPLRYQQSQIEQAPDRLARLQRYGAVNLGRLPFGLQYYFAPVWVLRGAHGQLLFRKTQLRMFDDVELPPSSFLLSDPVVCLLAGLGLLALARRSAAVGDEALARGALAGLAFPAAVMLLAISLTFRYRMDFYPALDFAACLGAAALRPERIRPRVLLYAGVLGALVSLPSLSLYSYSPFASALDLDLSRGWTGPIIGTAQGRHVYIGHLLPDGRRLPPPPPP